MEKGCLVSGSRGQQLHQSLNETLDLFSARSWFEVVIFISSLQIVTQMLLEVGVDVMMLRDVQGDNCICLAFKRGHTGGNSGTGCGTRGVGASVQSDS